MRKHTPVRARFALVVPLANSSVPSSFHCAWVSSTQFGNRLKLCHVGGVLFASPSKLVRGVEECPPPVGCSFLCCFHLFPPLDAPSRTRPDLGSSVFTRSLRFRDGTFNFPNLMSNIYPPFVFARMSIPERPLSKGSSQYQLLRGL